VKKTEIGRSYAVVIGDIVSSRTFEDQEALLDLVIRNLEWVNERTSPVQPLEMTIADEFQGAYANVGEALDAALFVQLCLLGEVELRFGCGWGEISRFDPESASMVQSGPAWWTAREALDEVVELGAKRLWPSTIRTRVRRPSEMPSFESTERLVNSFLMCRDALLASLDQKDARIALALFFRERPEHVAMELGISQPAVANRQKKKNLSKLLRAHQEIRNLVP